MPQERTIKVLFFCPDYLPVLVIILIGLPKNGHSTRWNGISVAHQYCIIYHSFGKGKKPPQIFQEVNKLLSGKLLAQHV